MILEAHGTLASKPLVRFNGAFLHREGKYITTCTIVVSHLKGTAIVYKPHVLRQCLSSQDTSMYPRVAGQLWLLLKTMKQLAGTINATMAQVICTMGF